MKFIIPTVMLLISMSIFANENTSTKQAPIANKIRVEKSELLQPFNKVEEQDYKK